MVNTLCLIAAILFLDWVVDRYNRRRTERLRQTGLYPPSGEGSDGERLICLGRKIAVVKLYCEVHGVDLKTAEEELAKKLPESPRDSRGEIATRDRVESFYCETGVFSPMQ